MTQFEAMELAAALKGAIPTMTDYQMGQAVSDLAEIEQVVGAAAVEHYTREHSEFRRPSLLSIIKAEKARLGGGTWNSPKYAEAAEFVLARDALIDDLSDQDLADLASQILPTMDSFARKVSGRLGPRKSTFLKNAIYERLRPRGAVA